MKKLYAVLLSLGLCVSLQAQAAFTLDLVTGSPQINLGDNLLVQVQVSGLSQGVSPSLADYDLNLNYDAALFAFDHMVWGDSLQGNQLDLDGFGGIAEIASPALGQLNFFQVSFDSAESLNSLQSDSFTLFSLVFASVATGSADFLLTANSLGDAVGNSLVLDAITGNKTVSVADSVTPVPLPAALPLLLSALGLMGLLGRRKV